MHDKVGRSVALPNELSRPHVPSALGLTTLLYGADWWNVLCFDPDFQLSKERNLPRLIATCIFRNP